MSDCIDQIANEDIGYCPSDEPTGGVSPVDGYLADISWVKEEAKLKEFKEATSYDELATIVGTHTFADGKGFLQVQILPETGEVNANGVGQKGQKSFVNEYSGTISGIGKKPSGFMRYWKNRNLIYIVRDNNGVLRQIGSVANPATFEELNLLSGKKGDDLVGVNFKVSAPSKAAAPIYEGTIAKPATPSS